MQKTAERFFSLIQAAFLREDAAVMAFGMMLDTPNPHRLSEVVGHVISASLRIRNAQELLIENAHQPLKRAILSGIDRADAGRAMKRYVHEELAPRIVLDFRFFHIPCDWIEHAGVSACLSHARKLWIQASAVWRCTTGAHPEANVHPCVVRLGAFPSDPAVRIRWRWRASSGGSERLQVNDAVCIRVAGGPALYFVYEACAAGGGTVAHFQIVAFFTSRAGTPSAVVNPFFSMEGLRYRVAQDRYVYLAVSPAVRRALALHACQCECQISTTAVSRMSTNVWVLYGRRDGYPGRNGELFYNVRETGSYGLINW